MGRLSGKVALVTGAGATGPGWGNGKASAVLFAREGAAVVACDINSEAAEDTQSNIAGEGGRCLALKTDVTSAESIEAAVARTKEVFGGIDILHNNGGTLELGRPVAASLARWRTVRDARE